MIISKHVVSPKFKRIKLENHASQLVHNYRSYTLQPSYLETLIHNSVCTSFKRGLDPRGLSIMAFVHFADTGRTYICPLSPSYELQTRILIRSYKSQWYKYPTRKFNFISLIFFPHFIQFSLFSPLRFVPKPQVLTQGSFQNQI